MLAKKELILYFYEGVLTNFIGLFFGFFWLENNLLSVTR